jgi:hypothetical protein
MRNLIIITFTFLFGSKTFSQDKWLFDKFDQLRWADSCNKNAKRYIEKYTDFRFDGHPLEWAQFQLDSNLLRADTLFDKGKSDRSIYYYNKQNMLFLVRTTSTQDKNRSKRIIVYDISGNLLFKEGYGDSGNLTFRLRRGYYGIKTQFECVYFDTPMYRFWVYTKSNKVVDAPVSACECNF